MTLTVIDSILSDIANFYLFRMHVSELHDELVCVILLFSKENRALLP